MNNNSKLGLIVLCFAIIYIVWGTTYLAMRVAVETIPPFAMAGTRFLMAGIVTLAFLKWRGVTMPTFNQWKQAAIVSLFLMVGGNGLVSWSEQEIPSGIASLVVATMPLWMCLFDWMFFKGPRPSVSSVFGLILGFVGIGVLFGPSIMSADTANLDLTSLLVLLLAPIFWSIGSLYARDADLPKNVFMSTTAQVLCGGLVLLAISAALGEWVTFDIAKVSIESFASMLYLAVFGSIIALSAYVWLLNQTSSARVATYTYINPIIAVFLGWLILGESINSQAIIAIVVIVTSVILVVASRRSPGNSETDRSQDSIPDKNLAPGATQPLPRFQESAQADCQAKA